MVESDGAPLRALFGGLHVLAGERSTFIIRHYFFALSDPCFSLRYELSRLAQRALIFCVGESGDTAIDMPLHEIPWSDL